MKNSGKYIIESFEPVVYSDSRVLILGTMPGQESLRRRQYYAHPHNLFWPLIYRIFGQEPEAEYTRRIRFLRKKKIALWDVFRSCRREGSLDSRIIRQEMNDAAALVNAAPEIRYVFCNGKMAGKQFQRNILPQIKREICYSQLPSTSPANASVPYAVKLDRWLQVRYALGDNILYRSVLEAEFGIISVYSNGSEIIRVCLPGGNENQPVNNAIFDGDALGQTTKEQIREYLAGERKVFSVPVKAYGTLFQEKVYRALSDIPYGFTVSYGELAFGIGNGNAARAVGQAVRKNPVPILVPCHRVIGAHRKNIGFMGIRNNPVQNMLLELEQRNLKSRKEDNR